MSFRFGRRKAYKAFGDLRTTNTFVYAVVLYKSLMTLSKKKSDIRGVNFHQMGEVRNTRKFSSGNILILCVFIKTAAARIKWEINWPKVY